MVAGSIGSGVTFPLSRAEYGIGAGRRHLTIPFPAVIAQDFAGARVDDDLSPFTGTPGDNADAVQEGAFGADLVIAIRAKREDEAREKIAVLRRGRPGGKDRQQRRHGKGLAPPRERKRGIPGGGEDRRDMPVMPEDDQSSSPEWSPPEWSPPE